MAFLYSVFTALRGLRCATSQTQWLRVRTFDISAPFVTWTTFSLPLDPVHELSVKITCSDVVHLCVEGAKVPVDRLWPAGALLLNLWELQQHAIAELRR